MIQVRLIETMLAAFLLVFASPRGDEQAYREALAAGDEAAKNNQWNDAAAAYREAKRLAALAKDPAKQGEASFRLIALLRRQAEANPKKDGHGDPWKPVIDEYREAITVGTTAQKELARNDFGVLYLHQKKPGEAVQVFAKDLNLVNASANIYLYNYGRALEQTNKNDAAYQQYLASLAKRPNYEPAARRALALLRESKAGDRVTEAAKLFRLLLEPKAHQVQVVGDELPQFFAAWKEGAAALLPVLLEYYIAADADPETFRTAEEPRLEQIRRSTAAYNNDFKVLQRAFDFRVLDGRHEPVFLKRADAVAFFPGGSRLLKPDSPEGRAFSRLLHYLADQNFRISLQSDSKDTVNQAARRALQLDSAAFFLDVRNVKALLAAASILGQYHEFLDPTNEWSRKMTENLFEVRSELYQKAKTSADWATIYSCHVVLGDLYRRQLPKPAWGGVDDLHSAIGQWDRAVQVEQLLRTGRSLRLGVSLPPSQVKRRWPRSPTLRLGLADAYLKTMDIRKAFNYYSDAADGFLDLGNPDRARQVTASVRARLPESAMDVKRLAGLERLAQNVQQVLTTNPLRTTGPDLLTALAFEHGEHRLRAAGMGVIGVVDLSASKFEPQPSDLAKGKTGQVVFAPEADYFAAAAGADVLVGDAVGGRVIHKLVHKDPVVSQAFSKDGEVLASSAAGTVYTWNAKSGKLLKPFEFRSGPVRGLVLSADGNRLAGAVGKDIWLWSRTGEGEPLLLQGHEQPVTALAIRNDGKLLVSADAGGRTRFWDGTSGQALRSPLPDQDGRILSLRLTPDGNTVLVVVEGGPVRLFNAESGREMVRLPSTGRFAAVAFSANGQTLAVGTAASLRDGIKVEGEIQVWNLGTTLQPK